MYLFTHSLMQDMNAFNLQLQMHKKVFLYFNTKTLNTEIFTLLKQMIRYFTCENKTASKWQQLTVSESL